MYLLFVFGLVFVFFSISFSFNGAVIGKNYDILDRGMFILGIVFLSCSFVLYIHSKSLEKTIVIPTGSLEADKDRTSRAMIEYSKYHGKTPYLMISGDIQRDTHGKIKKDSQCFGVYKESRKCGIKPSDMIIEGKSKDSLENFLYSIRILKKKGIKKMDIATNKTQYWRFKMFESKAKKEGLIEGDFEIAPLYTHKNPLQFYGILALIKDYVRIKSYDSLNEATKHKSGGFGNFLKGVLSKK